MRSVQTRRGGVARTVCATAGSMTAVAGNKAASHVVVVAVRRESWRVDRAQRHGQHEARTTRCGRRGADDEARVTRRGRRGADNEARTGELIILVANVSNIWTHPPFNSCSIIEIASPGATHVYCAVLYCTLFCTAHNPLHAVQPVH